jgi:Uma2 family endonuclease
MATANERTPLDRPLGVIVPSAPPAGGIPPLESGDRLTRAEFRRRYEAMPGVKAELVEGVVYMASPVNFEQHGEATRAVSTWLGVYQLHTPGIRGGDDSTTLLDQDNEPQPDHSLILPRSLGGQTTVHADGNLEGGPELIVEVAASSASYDLHDKLRAYRRNRVREYLVWRTRDQAFDWFVWREGEFLKLAPDSAGLLKSEVFPGLWLDVAAMVRGDKPAWYAALLLGVASPEHAAFVERLRLAGSDRGPP